MIDSATQHSLDAYTLTTRGDILAKLDQLIKRRTLLTATPYGESSGIGSTIVRVLPERGLMGVETGVDRAQDQRLLGAGLVIFRGQQDGVLVSFEASGLREATLNGRDLLALPIPDALLWLQRRHFFRAIIPYGLPIKCEVTLPDGDSHWFEVINLSVRGIALLDKSGRLRFWGRTGQVFENCRLDLAGFENERLNLEIRGKIETSDEDARTPTMRVGFAFRDVGSGLEAKIQRLLHELEFRARKERYHVDFRDL